MSKRWPAAAYTCLSVALYVAEPGHISLTTQDRVRIDRVAGTGVERHGDLLPAGTNTIHLAAGTYVFRTAHDAQIHLDGNPAVQVAATGERGKDDPDLVIANGDDASAVRVVAVSEGGKDIPPDPDLVIAKGDGIPDRVPVLTVHR